jgi:hypothetical protein
MMRHTPPKNPPKKKQKKRVGPFTLGRALLIRCMEILLLKLAPTILWHVLI